MHKTLRILICLAIAALASPAFAGESGVQLPEASNLMLFALGLLGVLIGRRAAMRGGDDEAE